MLFLLHETIVKDKKYKNKPPRHVLTVSVNDLFLVLNKSIKKRFLSRPLYGRRRNDVMICGAFWAIF
jgi:hypothetical protein